MKDLLIATNNSGKVREFKTMLNGISFNLVTPRDIHLSLDVEESGRTYDANAELKARAFCQASGLLTLADDSGLEVDALNGEPGIRSARYAGEQATDEQKVAFLLSKLKDIPQGKRTARFRCVIAILQPGQPVIFCRGKCEGYITFEPRGRLGFGYDPVFYFPELGQTMSELTEEVKNRVSHRGHATQEAVRVLQKL
ncbi:MAG TPA: XTP/dITP diphosphatase [Dehalococcoidales bacterium]|nr:XTP/dITP diphosphatase [Dehalococcoidales bacterium]